MKINAISPKQFQNIKLNNNNNHQKTNLQQDIFVKNISFGARGFESKFENLKKDLTSYFSQNKPQVKKIEKIIKKYCPNIEICNLDDNKVKNLIKQDCTAALVNLREACVNENGKTKLETSTKTLLVVNTNMTKPNERKILLKNILHECVHLLQQECLDKTTVADYINTCLETGDEKSIHSDCSKIMEAYHLIEGNIIEKLQEVEANYLAGANLGFANLISILNGGQSSEFIDKIDFNIEFQKLYNQKINQYIKNLIQQNITEKEIENIDIMLECFKIQSQNEIEAYTKTEEKGSYKLKLMKDPYIYLIQAIDEFKDEFEAKN